MHEVQRLSGKAARRHSAGTGRAAEQNGVANSFDQSIFGVAAGGSLQNESSAQLTTDLDADQTVGAKWLRVDINWDQIQYAGPTSYNWTDIDSVVRGAEARGMKVLGLILYTPPWDRPAGSSATYGPSAASYAAFAGVAAAHYANLGVQAYEIWNEENSSAFWSPAPDPKQYTDVLKAAHSSIKSSDPSATVVSGGLSPDISDGTNYAPTTFLEKVYANGGGGSFDAVGIHPYCWPASPGAADSWSTWYQMYGTGRSLRSIMTAHGDGAKKIWGTEFGAPTGGPAGSYVSQAQQATMISSAFGLWSSYTWAGPLFIYQGRDEGTSPTTNQNFFGFLNYNGTRKLAFAAYQQAVTSI